MKKKIIIILVCIFGIGLLSVIANKIYWDYRVKHATKIVELTTNQVLVYQSDVTIQKLLKELNGSLETNPTIKTDKIGKQEVTFKYINDEKIPITYTVEIEVVDITPPMIFQGSRKNITEGYEDDIATELFCGDNYDPNPKCFIEGEYDQNTPGSYDVVFVGEDQSGNRTEHAFTLNVKPKTKSSSSYSGPVEYTDFNEIKEKYKEENVQFGIDISHHQGDIDFEKVKEAGVDFVYIRIGRGNGVGKEYVEDNKFQENLKGFNEVGIPVGVYFYSNANGVKDAEKEAKWLMKKTKGYQVNTPVWLAHYTEQTNYEGDYVVWQICEDGKVDGINGVVDLDIRYQ